MTLLQLLETEKKAINDRWFDLILSTYPADAAQFFRSRSTFTNPVGQSISQGVDDILDGLITGADLETYRPFLDGIIRVRAVQDFTASNAVIFIFHLKTAIRERCLNRIQSAGLLPELLLLESRIDELAVMAFDIFMRCREKLYDLKANELKDRTLWLLKRTGFLTEIEDEPEQKAGNCTNIKQTKEVH